MKVTLMRHGTTSIDEFSQSPWDALSKDGEEQVTKLVNKLQKYRIPKLYSSDFVRCRQTAEMIAKKHNDKPDLILSYELREILFWPNPLTLKRVPKAEKDRVNLIYEKEKRNIFDSIIDLLEESGEENIFIVTHGNVIRAIISSIIKLSIPKMIDLRIDNASINVIHFDSKNNKFEVEMLNNKKRKNS